MRKVIIVLVVAFIVYFLLTQPEGMADALGNIGSWIADLFEAIITFFTELF